MDGNISALLGRLDLGVTYLAGAGAIGNAVVWALTDFDVRGELHVCDPDHVSDGNLNRCVWFTDSDVGELKAPRLAAAAQPHVPGLRLVPHATTLDGVAARRAGPWLQRLIVGVDSRRVRRVLQHEFPREVYDASTTGITEVVLHFNSAGNGLACLSCVYRETEEELAHEAHVAALLGVSLADVRAHHVSPSAAAQIVKNYPALDPLALEGLAYDSLFKQLCGQGSLKTAEDRQVLAPFGFVSVLAGILLAIEIARRVGAPNIDRPFNYWRVSPWRSPVPRLRQLRGTAPKCEFCHEPLLRKLASTMWLAG